ncbi:MAG TPA: hypothetical protein VI259_10400 [Gemmatimonadaceae bacterium]
MRNLTMDLTAEAHFSLQTSLQRVRSSDVMLRRGNTLMLLTTAQQTAD